MTARPLVTSQILTVGSQRVGVSHAPPFTMSLPSGLNVAAVTDVTCPSNTPTVFPVLASQIRVVPSRLTVTTNRPSGLNTPPSTPLECPSRVATLRQVEVSRTRAVLSLLTDRTYRPSGLKTAP